MVTVDQQENLKRVKILNSFIITVPHDTRDLKTIIWSEWLLRNKFNVTVGHADKSYEDVRTKTILDQKKHNDVPHKRNREVVTCDQQGISRETGTVH